MISGMYTSVNTTYNYTTPACATGNCKWPSFGSLAVCVQTNDITDKLIVEELAQQCCTSTATDRFDGSTWSQSCTNCTQTGLSRNDQIYLTPKEVWSLNSTIIDLEAGVSQSWSVKPRCSLARRGSAIDVLPSLDQLLRGRDRIADQSRHAGQTPGDESVLR